MDESKGSASASDDADGSEATLLDRFGETLSKLVEESRQLRLDFDSKLKADNSKQLMLDRLHDELTTYRVGLADKVSESIIDSLLSLDQEVARRQQAFERDTRQEFSLADVLKLMRDFRDDLEVLLRRQGITQFENASAAFDGGIQEAVRTTPCRDQQLPGTIAARVQPGYKLRGRVVRPELVEVYVASAAPSAPKDFTDSTPGATVK